MTHRVELCKQTSNMLTEFGVINKVVDSKANLEDQGEYDCFVAMVETLNNRLNDDKLDISDIGLVIIDGIADLVSDVNNLEESNLCVQKIMQLSAKYDCHIVTVIHSNYGSDKPTGHLGSFLEKKTENQIQLEINTVNKEWITVSCKRSRGYAFDTFSFSINEFGLPFVVGEIYDPLEYFVPRTLTKTNL